MADYTYPTNQELKAIEPERMATLTMDDPIFDYFPVVNVDADTLSWEQEDDYTGLQAVRGINGQPKRIAALGGKRFTMEPGYYGELCNIDELELTRRRQWGTHGTPINIQDLVVQADDRLLGREVDRVRLCLWTLVMTGTFTVLNENGQQLYAGAYTMPYAFTASTAWSTAATSTPLADIRNAVLGAYASGASFGSDARIFMNRQQLAYMVANTNSADLGGRRTSGLTSVWGLDEINKVLLGEDLPQVVPYDKGYITDAGTRTRFVPTNKAVIFGNRPGNQPIGDYAKTRNANNDNLEPGSYSKVVDHKDEVPRKIEVHRGHNGGVRMYFPTALIPMASI